MSATTQVSRTKIHCPQGHPYSGDNVRIDARGSQVCKTCSRAAEAKYRSKKTSAINARRAKVRPVVAMDAPKSSAAKFCKHGHALTCESVKPPRADGRRVDCKVCMAEQRRRIRKGGILRAETVRKIIALANEGMTISGLAGWRGNSRCLPRVVDRSTLKNFMDRNPKIGQVLRKKFTENAVALKAAGNAARRTKVAAPALVRNMGVLEQIDAALTMWLDPVTERPDIVSAMWMAIAEGHLKSADIKARAKEFVSAHRRQYTNTGRYGSGSLDAPAYRDSETPLIETITTGLWQ